MTVKDLLGGTLISLSMAAIALVVNTLTMAAPRVNLLVSSAICLFLCGPLFLVMARRIGHRGPLLIYYIVLSVIFILMGYYFMPLYLIPVGVIGELLMVKGSYEKLSRILLLWTYHSFFNVLSSLLPIYFSWDSYIEASKASGFSLAYAMLYKDFYTDYRIVALVILLNTTGGFLGALLGIKLFKKHFLPLGS